MATQNTLERQTQTHSLATTTSDHLRWLAPKINRLRVACGWNIIPAEELKIVGPVWLAEVARYKISPELVDLLCDRMIDNRVQLLKREQHAPNPSPEALLVEFEKYRSEKVAEYRRRRSEITYRSNLLKDITAEVEAPTGKKCFGMTEAASKVLKRKVKDLEDARNSLPDEAQMLAELSEFWLSTKLTGPEPEPLKPQFYHG